MAPKSAKRNKNPKAAKTRQIDKIDRLVAIAAQECAEAGIALIFKDVEMDRQQNLGSFSASSKELLVMTKNGDWVEVLAHELGHLRQMREGVFKSEDEYGLWEDWLAGKAKLDMAQVIHCARYIGLCELDCEKRALALLKELKILTPKQQRDYIQRANCYVLMHEVARRQGAWSNPKTPAAHNPTVYGLLPTTWITDVGYVSDEFEAAVVDNCY